MINTAVVLAAGLGTRFGEKTEKIPKGFIEVGGKSMIVRSIEMLLLCGIKRIIIGTGYRKEMFENLKYQYPQLEFCNNDKYEVTNSMWTLSDCAPLIGDDDFLLLESDLIFEKKAITSLIENANNDIMLSSNVIKFQDSYFIESDANDCLTNCSINRNELDVQGELVGIHKISNIFYKNLCKYYYGVCETKPKMGYEFALLTLAQTKMPLFVLKIEGLLWYEIDDDADLAYAEKNIIQYI